MKGAQSAEPAGSVAKTLVDLLGEQVEEEIQRTFAETQLLSDLEMQNALNAARKNATREQLRGLKATLDALLEHNENAPEIERIPREEIVLDRELRDSIIKDGDQRVLATQTKIRRDNTVKDLMAKRIKELAWDSMSVHGAKLLSFTTAQTVHNFPIRVPTEQEKLAIEKVRAMRRIEISMTKAQKKELGMSNSLIELAVADTAAGGDAAARVAEAAEGVLQGETAEDPDEVWIRNQDDPCLYHRFEVSTRERKTSQIIMLEDCITRAKQSFNTLFDDFMKRKVVVLGKIEEKNLRIVEIQEELGSNEELFDARLNDEEQPDRVLIVEDSDVKVEKWVSKEEIRRRQEEEEAAKKKGEGEDAADRALMGMMGGTLAGESKVNKLNETLEKPAHLTPGEGEELTEEQAKELKEWEAQKKALEAEQETYRKALEGENKKLRAEILEECKKFDDGMQELVDARLKTDYNVYEQELYKIKLIQAVAQEEDDIAASIALKKSLTEMDERREGAARAVDEFSSEVSEAERQLEGLKTDSANNEKHFKKEVVDPASAGSKDVAEMLLRTYRRRGDLRELPPALSDEVMQRAEELLEEAVQHDGLVAEAQAAAQAVRGELERLTWTLKQMDDSIHAAEEELQELETRMMSAGSDLDLTLMLKQGQVEVEQAAVATDFSDAEIVEKGVIHANNSLITTSGKEKVAILFEIKDFRKGIHVLQWENSRLDLEEEELLQRTKDLQLLRVTKGLQSIIKGSDEGKTAHENSSLEKLVSYQTKVHGQRVKEKAKSVEGLTAQARVAGRENAELDEDIFALESAVVERQRLCELQGTAAQQGEGRAKKSEESKMRMMVTHRKLLDLAKAQTREIELMREELVRLRARTFPSFAQLSQASLPDTII
uniref:Uncharacterized protein n=2 Tax=Hemiselmis andersenii TaxID=464988 RepID=A0A7S0Y3F9_HEMAN